MFINSSDMCCIFHTPMLRENGLVSHARFKNVNFKDANFDVMLMCESGESENIQRVCFFSAMWENVTNAESWSKNVHVASHSVEETFENYLAASFHSLCQSFYFLCCSFHHIPPRSA